MGRCRPFRPKPAPAQPLLTFGGAAASAPGAPGEAAHWAPADKDGFCTAHNTTSKVWHTLQGGELTDVY